MKLSAVLLLLILTACATPPRPALPVPASTVSDVMAGFQARETLTSIDTMATATKQAELWAADSTRTAQDNGTATAQSFAATRDYAATATMAVEQTAVSKVTETAIAHQANVAATATKDVFNREQIELEALTTRRHAETVASVTAVYLDSQRDINNAKRSNVGWWGFLLIFLILLFMFGYTVVRVINNRADFLYMVNDETVSPPPLQITGRVHGVRTRRSEIVPVAEFREPFELLNSDGETVHIFDGNALENMEANIERGDFGFRRGTNGDSVGMDELAEIRGGDKYQPVLSAMKYNGYVESVGLASKWTDKGMVDVLGMDTAPAVTTPPA